jgi:ABC-type nickel/cobalt efflux system permease component RcnA
VSRSAGRVQGGRLTFLVAWLAVASASAHDIPNERVDRSIQVVLGPGRLGVVYEVSLAELTLVRDLRSLIGPLPAEDRRALYERYGAETGPLNARGLLVSVDGRPLDLVVDGFDLAIEEHPRFSFRFSAPLPGSGRLALQDINYAASEGTSRLALRAEPGVRVTGYEGAADVRDVPERPVWQLSDAEERATREVSVAIAPAEPGAPAAARAAPAAGAGALPDAELVRRDPLNGLLDRAAAVSLPLLLVLAFMLGLAHAIQPGHGKTLVAAATLGEGGGWTRGVLLALLTTIAHVGGVLVLALVLWLTGTARYGTIQAGLVGVAGFLIAAIGLWRLGRHLGGHGTHGSAGHPERPRGRGGLVGLGLAGGLVPCWDAVLLVILAAAQGRLGLGLALLGAFSLGMAAVLTLVGVVLARLGRTLGASGAAWERGLGLASGAALAVIGLVLLLRA